MKKYIVICRDKTCEVAYLAPGSEKQCPRYVVFAHGLTEHNAVRIARMLNDSEEKEAVINTAQDPLGTNK